jgi:hypothetical protein
MRSQQNRRGFLRGTAVTAVAATFAARTSPVWAAPVCTGVTRTSESQMTPLPPPRVKGTLTLEETLAQRRSIREFSDASLALTELGQLLWAAQGITGLGGGRTAPSAGSL